MLTHARLTEVLYYHPESGDFVWLEKTGRKVTVGTQAGSLDGAGYTQIKIDGATYRAQRLAWFYVTGHWPKHKVDHRDTVKRHNWWRNLRPATTAENGFNARLSAANTTGLKNITWSRRARKWRVAMQVDEKHRDFGLYKELDEAISACAQVLITFRGDFARVC